VHLRIGLAQQRMRFVSWPKLYDWVRAQIGDKGMGHGHCSSVVSGEDAAGAQKGLHSM